MEQSLFKKTLSHTPGSFALNGGISVNAIGHYRHTTDHPPFYRNYFPHHQLFFTVSGRGWLDYKGTYSVIQPGTITCINLQKRHGIGAMEGEVWEHYWLQCTGPLMEQVYDLLFDGRNIWTHPAEVKLKQLFKELYALKQCNSLYFDLKALGLLVGIFSELASISPVSSIFPNEPSYAMIEKAASYISHYYMSEISIEELAEIAGYSKFHFSRLFRKYTGFSPNGYILKTRIEQGRNLLRNTADNIETVAAKCGFHSQNYFVRAFNKLEGITPGQFRKQRTF